MDQHQHADEPLQPSRLPAQDRFRTIERNSQQKARLGDLDSQFDELAGARDDVAEATREIAAAIRESAKSQREIASLSESVQ